MPRYACRVEYVGKDYFGWQVQPDRISVQSVLEDALTKVLREDISTICGGRTDAGVSAIGQVVHFDTKNEIDLYRLNKGVNSVLPKSIAIYNCKQVDREFHARFSATKREYIYRIVTRKRPLIECATYIPYEINWDKVKANIHDLKGEHIFSSFCSVGYYSDNHTCTVDTVELDFIDDTTIELKISANRFVYKMVRTIVGTLLEIGKGKITRSIQEIIELEDRKFAGPTAPAEGLTFNWVYYENY